MTTSQNPYALTPPEVVIRADVLPGWRDVLPRHQPPDARCPPHCPGPPLLATGGRKAETGLHLRPASANAFDSQRCVGEAVEAPFGGRQGSGDGADDECKGNRGTGPAYPRELPEVQQPDREEWERRLQTAER